MNNEINSFKNSDEYRNFLNEKTEKLFNGRAKISKREFLSLFSDAFSEFNTTGKKRFEKISNMDGDNTTISKKEMIAFYTLIDLDISGKIPDGKIDVKNSVINNSDDKNFESIKDRITSEKIEPATLKAPNTDEDKILFQSLEVQNPNDSKPRFNPDDYTIEKIKEKFPEPKFQVKTFQLFPGVAPLTHIYEEGKAIGYVSVEGDDVYTGRYYYDDHGNTIKSIDMRNGEITKEKAYKYSYDEHGNITYKQRFEDGKLLGSEYTEYNEYNHPVLEITISPDGKQISRKEKQYNTFVSTYVLDENGIETEVSPEQLVETQQEVDLLRAEEYEAYLISDVVKKEINQFVSAEVVYDENGIVIREYREGTRDDKSGQEIPGIEDHSPVADDIYKAINAKNKLGLPTTDMELLKESIAKLTPSNFQIISSFYELKSGKTLVEDLESEWGARITDNKDMKEILRKVKLLTAEHGTQKGYTALLKDELEGTPSVEVLDKLIYSDNLWRYKDIVEAQTGKSIIQSIMDKYLTLSLEKRKEYITYIMDEIIGWNEGEPDYAGMKEYREKVYAEFNRQLEKIGTMDATKLEQLLGAAPRNTKYKEKNIMNGKIDMDFSQGYNGDCWLMSAIMAINLTPGGEKYFARILHPNSDGNEDVKFPDAENAYTITKKDVEIGGFLNSSNGDVDVKAIEKAAEKYLMDLGYKGSDPLNDGNLISAGLKILAGNDRVKIYTQQEMTPDFINREFSKSDNAVVIGRYNTKHTVNEALNVNGEKVELQNGHGFALTRIDENFVYFVDPNYSKVELHISKEDYIKAFDECAVAAFNL